jgi:hypothetical protein
MTDLRQASTILRYYASIPIAVLCLIALSLFVVIGFKSILGPILGATAGGLVALFVLHIRPLEVDLSTDIENSLPDYRIATIVTCLYITTLVIAYLDVIHKRPIIHYMLFGGFAAYVAYEIALGARHRRVLPQLFALTFFTYWSVQFAFPLGMFNADARGSYLPEIRTALDTGAIETTYGTLGHMVYALETILITGLSPRIGYFLLGVLILTSTLFLIGIIDRILPAISKQTALYAALFFGCSAWTLGRGFRPSKLAFFYGLTLLIGLVVIVQYIGSSRERKRWMLIGVIATPAIIYGHRFSAGAAMVFIVVLAVFLLIASEWSLSTYERVSVGSLLAFSAAYTISVIGTPVHQEPLLQRLSSLLVSVVAPTSSAPGGGPGRYSEVAMELLLVSTAGEAILFGLGVLGVTIAIRRGNWEHDIVVFWMAALSLLLIVSLLFNAADVPAQRFYALLALFGLNIFAGVGLVWLVRAETKLITPHSVGIVIFVFALLSLGSPVASMHFSFVSDDVPHYRAYETHRIDTGQEWTNEFQTNSTSTLEAVPPENDLPIQRTSKKRAEINISEIQRGTLYLYSGDATRTGVRIGGGPTLGGRTYVFLHLTTSTNQSKVYSNNDSKVYFSG